MSRRRAFSFAEAIIAIVVGTILIGVAWSALSSTTRQGQKTDIRLQGVKAGVLFVQRFEHDMRRMYVDANHPLTINPDGTSGIRFSVFDDANSDLRTSTIKTVTVQYSFDGTKHAIYRKEGSGKERRLKGSYETLVFARHTWQPPTGGGTATLAPLLLLTYLVTCTPATVLEHPLEDRRAQDRTTFWGSLPITGVGERRHYPHWLQPPYSWPTP